MEKKYLVTADVSREPYSSAEYLFGIFDTKEEAIQFMRDWKPKRKRRNDSWGDYASFNFVKGLSGKHNFTDAELEHWYIQEFDGTPICIASHWE